MLTIKEVTKSCQRKNKKQRSTYIERKNSQKLLSISTNPCIKPNAYWLRSLRSGLKTIPGKQPTKLFSNQTQMTNNQLIYYSKYCQKQSLSPYNHFIESNDSRIMSKKQLKEFLNEKLGIVNDGINVKYMGENHEWFAGKQKLKEGQQHQKKIKRFMQLGSYDIFDDMQEIMKAKLTQHNQKLKSPSTLNQDKKIFKRKSHKQTIISTTNIHQTKINNWIPLQSNKENHMKRKNQKSSFKINRGSSSHFPIDKEKPSKGNSIPLRQWEIHDSLDITHLQIRAKEEKENRLFA